MSEIYKGINPEVAKALERDIEEEYNRVKPYLDTNESICSMCRDCERWCEKEHDYSECRDRPCFIFWLAFKHLALITGYELYGG